jgi:hypothetical protein
MVSVDGAHTTDFQNFLLSCLTDRYQPLRIKKHQFFVVSEINAIFISS